MLEVFAPFFAPLTKDSCVYFLLLSIFFFVVGLEIKREMTSFYAGFDFRNTSLVPRISSTDVNSKVVTIKVSSK